MLTICILVAADPVLEAAVGMKESGTRNEETASLVVIDPEEIVLRLAEYTGSDIRTFGSAAPEETEVFYVCYPEDYEYETDIQDDGNDESTVEYEGTPDMSEAEETEEPEYGESTEECDAELTLSEKKELILNELTENGSYTFIWYDTEITISYSDYLYLCKLVQRETVGEDLEGRMMVANVVMNRVRSKSFPNTVLGVIKQPYQFSPVTSGTINTATPDETTIDAVLSVLAGMDYSQGALYFKMRDYYSASFEGMYVLFTHGCHTFYK